MFVHINAGGIEFRMLENTHLDIITYTLQMSNQSNKNHISHENGYTPSIMIRVAFYVHWQQPDTVECVRSHRQ